MDTIYSVTTGIQISNIIELFQLLKYQSKFKIKITFSNIGGVLFVKGLDEIGLMITSTHVYLYTIKPKLDYVIHSWYCKESLESFRGRIKFESGTILEEEELEFLNTLSFINENYNLTKSGHRVVRTIKLKAPHQALIKGAKSNYKN
jgi:hypothetical protein